MALTQLTTDLSNHQNLADKPNQNEGYTSTQLKVLYDKAPNDIKEYINTVLLPALESVTDGSSGADKIGATEIATGSGTTVQAVLEWLKTQIDNTVLGDIPDGSLTNAKLATDIKIGSLASLTTTDKSSVVNAVNEHLADTVKHVTQSDKDNWNNTIKITKNVTLTSASWVDDTATSGYWVYDVNDVDVDTDTIVDVMFHLASLDNASDVKGVESFVGYYRLYASAQPTVDLTIDIKKVRQVV